MILRECDLHGGIFDRTTISDVGESLPVDPFFAFKRRVAMKEGPSRGPE